MGRGRVAVPSTAPSKDLKQGYQGVFEVEIDKMDPVRPQDLQSEALSRARQTWGWLFAALLGLALIPSAALAGTTPALFQSFAGNVNFVTTGNTLRAGDNTTNASASSLLSGLSGNPVSAGTSSETISGIPAGSTIVAAYLYWAGSGSTTDYTVTLNGTSVTAPANRQYTETYNAGGGDVLAFFSGAADVTSIVQGVGGGTGNGTYTFTGLNVTNVDVGAVTYLSNQATTAGWSMVVIYSNNTTESNRVINVFEGFQAFRNTSITLTPNNFRVPATGINGKFAVITWEGDPNAPSDTGETLTFNGTALSDACNTNGNQYNSTINTLICTGNPATDDVFYGVDVDTYDVSASLTAGSTSATTIYQSGNDLVLLSSQIISVANTPVSDLGITKVHNGIFGYGDNGTYTLTVTNNGPASTSGTTTTVTDTLPAGETFVSGTGTGWNACTAAGQNVTCTSTAAIASGSSFNPITLTVAIATGAGTSLANTATVATTNFDNTSGNNSSTDTVSNALGTLVHPDLSTSAKSALNPSGGDIVANGTVEYAITLNETAGVDASSVSVTDPLDASLTGLTGVTVTGSTTTATNTSSATTLNLANITVPANGTVTITFTATVKATVASCTAVNNTATVNYAGGSPTSTNPSYNFVTAQSSCTASGNKILYVYDNTGPTYTNILNRIPQTTSTGTGITLNGGTSHTWNLSPVLAKNLVLSQGNITVALIETNTNAATTTRRNTTVSLLNNATVLATSATVQTSNTANATVITYTITITAAMVTAGTNVIAAGHTLGITLNNAATANNHILVSQLSGALASSRITFATSTVISVDSVNVYNAPFPATTTSTFYAPGSTVYICAAISDPFGSYDVNSAIFTIVDSNGALAAMANSSTTPPPTPAVVDEGAKTCNGTASTSTEAYEYAYTLGASGTIAIGNWVFSVTGNEGTEGTVSHTANGTFTTKELPILTVMKSVTMSNDPTGSAIGHSIPGSTAVYAITVLNSGRGTVDSGSMVISDPVPANTVFNLTGKPPFAFSDPGNTSGLSIVAGTDTGNITYTDHSNNPYTPTCTRPCTDANIGGFTITLTGTMKSKTGATTPTFTITYQVLIN